MPHQPFTQMTTVPTVLNRWTQAGFSMLELLIATAILLLMTGGGIATMVQFNDRQQLREAAALTQDTLRAAQTRAKIGDLPEACHVANDALANYQVVLTASSPMVFIRVNCGGQTITTDTITLPGGVSPQASVTVAFLPLYGGVQGASEITLQNSGKFFTFAVTDQGEITTGALE